MDIIGPLLVQTYVQLFALGAFIYLLLYLLLAACSTYQFFRYSKFSAMHLITIAWIALASAVIFKTPLGWATTEYCGKIASLPFCIAENPKEFRTGFSLSINFVRIAIGESKDEEIENLPEYIALINWNKMPERPWISLMSGSALSMCLTATALHLSCVCIPKAIWAAMKRPIATSQIASP